MKRLIFFIVLCGVVLEFFRRNKNDPCEGFDLIVGNLSLAVFVVLGENHKEPARTNRCVDFLTEKHKDKHRVLAEAVPYTNKVKCKDVLITERPGRECWGSEKASVLDQYRDHFESKCVYKYINKLSQTLNSRVSPAKIDTGLRSQSPLFKVKNKTNDSLKFRDTSECTIRLVKETLKLRDQKFSYPEIVDLFSKRIIKDREKMVDDRNQAMLEGMKYHRDSRIFCVMVVGDDHINPRGQYPKSAKKFLAAFENEDNKKAQPGAVLVSKRK